MENTTPHAFPVLDGTPALAIQVVYEPVGIQVSWRFEVMLAKDEWAKAENGRTKAATQDAAMPTAMKAVEQAFRALDFRALRARPLQRSNAHNFRTGL